MKSFDPLEKNYSVYVHVFPNGKLYIGSTRQTPIYRWRRGGGYKNCKTMATAINEFGWDNIQHIVLMDELDQKTAMIVERELVKKYQTQNPEYGYNTKNGGQHFDVHSEEFIEALRNRMFGNEYSVGRKMSDSHRKALSMANKGKSKPHVGIPLTEESKRKISEKAKERWMTHEYREKVLASRHDMSGENNPMYGRKQSAETKARISEKNKGMIRPLKARRAQAEKISKAVYALNGSMQIITEYPSIKKAAEAIGAKPSNIGFCCRNLTRRCRTYYWRYKEEFDADRC